MDYSVRDLCSRRRLKAFDVATPLLVPSFSSKGFPELKTLYKNLEAYLPDTILISCYDVFYDLLESKNVANLMFLDSGGYETNVDADLSNTDQRQCLPKHWDKEKHISALRKIETLNTCVAITYDNPGMPILDQIKNAEDYLLEIPSISLDFLAKPYLNKVLDLSEIESGVGRLLQFDVLGVTEKELGHSVSERMKTIAGLRMMLSKHGLDIPIHIFGCFDPASIWLYFLCGADVFDGLSWLRYTFDDVIGMYRNSWAIMTEQIELSDQDVLYKSYLQNIQIFEQCQREMAKFSDDYDLSHTPIDAKRLERLLNSTGISL